MDRSPADFLAALSQLAREAAVEPPAHPTLDVSLVEDLARGVRAPARWEPVFPNVVLWDLGDVRRITAVPPGHWLLVHDTSPFRATLEFRDGSLASNVESTQAGDGHMACFAPSASSLSADADLRLERYAVAPRQVEAAIRFLAPFPSLPLSFLSPSCPLPSPLSVRPTDLVLLTNGRGGMARICVDLGRVNSKYDCVLGANLHPTLPVNRHVLAKRIRVWVNADGFISPLDYQDLAALRIPGRRRSGDSPLWRVMGVVSKSGSRPTMLEERNSTVFRFSRPAATEASGKQLPASADVRLTVRLDIEDRDFHSETRRNPGSEHHYSSSVQPLTGSGTAKVGFAFNPAADRRLRVFADHGDYHPAPEWSQDIPHPVEQSRGQTGSGDAYSPGWFDLPLQKGAAVTLVATADPTDPEPTRAGESLDDCSRRERVLRRRRCLWPGFIEGRPRLCRSPRLGKHRHRRLSVVSGLGPRHVHLRARTAGGRLDAKWQNCSLTFGRF